MLPCVFFSYLYLYILCFNIIISPLFMQQYNYIYYQSFFIQGISLKGQPTQNRLGHTRHTYFNQGIKRIGGIETSTIMVLLPNSSAAPQTPLHCRTFSNNQQIPREDDPLLSVICQRGYQSPTYSIILFFACIFQLAGLSELFAFNENA